MLKSVKVNNYKSFIDAEAQLSSFTLVIGPNGAGKSNFLQLLTDLVTVKHIRKQNKPVTMNQLLLEQKHLNATGQPQRVVATHDDGVEMVIADGVVEDVWFQESILKFSLDPSTVGRAEQIQPNAHVNPTGRGAVSVLDGLKTGAREDLFNEIEKHLTLFVPSVRKLSTRIAKPGQKELQVEEHGIETPFPVEMLSEGTKLILLFLTIVFQENPPQLVLLEDIDRGLHPRLFQRVVEMLRSVVDEKGIQIVATTHNPYLLDEFVGEEQSILIVEKENAESKITSLADRLEGGETLEDALGAMWFGGFVGGVPK